MRLEVDKAISKLKKAAKAYGNPLGNKIGIDLFGFFSIRAGKCIRVIYSIEESNDVIIRVIGNRDKFAVHQTAQKRILALSAMAAEELRTLEQISGSA